MKKTYEPNGFEKEIYEKWEDSGFFRPSEKGDGYCIMLPPPNVTGSLHMGHGFQHTLMDALTRYHRMRGFNTLWQPGTDHAGISTQMVVERQLMAQDISRHDLGREEFVKKIWEWKHTSGDTILRQMRRLGTSPDWEKMRFTMDEQLSESVHEVFNQLYDEGLIYRGKRLVNWDPKLQTAISDLEVINTDEKGFLWHFKYPLSDGSGFVVIATTRPETMLGDTAVAVHPEDDRYKNLIGKMIQLPICDRKIPIIADEYVEREFGSGCVKITPAHDFNDYAIGERHNLPIINILNPDATLCDDVPENYRGLDRYDARKKIVTEFKTLKLLEKIEDYALTVPRGDRSHEIIEPYLTDQWFVKIEPLAKPAIEAVESGKIKFVPDNWKNTYFQWMNNIQDWCISRQLWWGHRIPAWYDKDGNIYVGRDEAHARKKNNLDESLELTQDEDVLDTWFSSALWPFSTLGWPEKTPELKNFYPTNVLVTGFDIIFFWVARMIMFGLKFTGDIPFHEVYITGLIRDQEGQKMSKSKGNVLDPIDLIDGIQIRELIDKRIYGLMQPEMAKKIEQHTREQFPNGIKAYGTDALRFTYCSLASTGRDIRFDLGRLEGYRNFCNKLWNATRFVLMNVGDYPITASKPSKNIVDRWILSRLQKTIASVHEHFKNYRFDLIAQTLHEFTWHEFCDWYLELTKPILMGDYDDEYKLSSKVTLINVLETILRLLHPIIPFVTEELWQTVAPICDIKATSIMIQPYPETDKNLFDEEAENDITWLQNIILVLRNVRGEMNLAPSKKITLLLSKGNKKDKERMDYYEHLLMSLAKIESIDWQDKNLPECATALSGELELYIPLAGLIDIDAEKKRLQKEIDKLKKDLSKTTEKLNNPNFVKRAPKEIVGSERERVKQMEIAINKLKKQIGLL